MLETILLEYADKFDDNFPTFHVLHLEEAEIIELVQTSIDNNTPYEPDYQDDADY